MNAMTKITALESAESTQGLYSLSEAALFSRVPARRLSYWYYGVKNREPLRETQIEENSGRFITFMEFVEAIAIRSLTQARNVPLQKIRAAIIEANDKYGIRYPFAQQTHKTVLVGKDLHILLEDDARMVGLTGREKGQESMKPFLEPYIENLKFDENNMACEFEAYRYGEGDKVIKMNPKVGFGEPIVGNTGYSAETLWRAAVNESSIDKACQYYEVDRGSVVAACNYWESLAA